MPAISVFTVRSSYASAVLGIVILSVRPSVCLSVTRVLCDKTKESTAEILIPHERVINLVFWCQKSWWALSPSTWNLRLTWPTPFGKRRLRLISAYNVSTVRANEKCSIIANRKSTRRFLTGYRWSAYVTPNYPKGWLKNQICRFCEENSSSVE